MVHPLFHIVYLVCLGMTLYLSVRSMKIASSLQITGHKARIKPRRMAGVWCYTLAAVVLICASMLDPAEAVGGAKSRPRPQRRPPKKPKVEPTDATLPAQNVDMQRVRKRR